MKVRDYKSRTAFVFEVRFPNLGHFERAFLIEIMMECIHRFGILPVYSGSWILESNDIHG